MHLQGSKLGACAGDDTLGKCLYISGVPGTGKTATVMEILRQARRRADTGQLPRFQLVEINGNRLPSPYHAYTHLYEARTNSVTLYNLRGTTAKMCAPRPLKFLCQSIQYCEPRQRSQ